MIVFIYLIFIIIIVSSNRKYWQKMTRHQKMFRIGMAIFIAAFFNSAEMVLFNYMFGPADSLLSIVGVISSVIALIGALIALYAKKKQTQTAR